MARENEADWDRAIRMLAGIMLLYAGGGGFVSGTLALLLIGLGAIALVTGLIGWCPLYRLCRLTTRSSE